MLLRRNYKGTRGHWAFVVCGVPLYRFYAVGFNARDVGGFMIQQPSVAARVLQWFGMLSRRAEGEVGEWGADLGLL